MLALGAIAAPPALAEEGRRMSIDVPFVRNEGQWDAAVAYSTRSAGATVFVTRTGRLVYSLIPSGSRRGASAPGVRPPSSTEGRAWTVVERAVGGAFRPSGGEPAPTRVSFFLGNDSSRWRQGVETARALTLGEVWPGIEVGLRADSGRLEKLIVLRPGSDPSRIRIRVDGSESLGVAPGGALTISTGLGELRFTPPVAYQERGLAREPVSAAYVVRGRDYGFRIGPHDPTLPVVIDPILQSTFAGGAGSFDQVNGIAFHPTSGDVYAGGITNSTTFPGVSGGAQAIFGGGNQDGFIARFSADLTTLKQATYLGGSAFDELNAIAIHPTTGDIYVCGDTQSSNFPGTAGSPQTGNAGGIDAFVARLNANLTTAPQSTYLGAGVNDYATGLAIHPTSGEVYAAGFTDSTTLPFTSGGYQPNRANTGSFEAWVARLNSGLTAVPAPQATFLGGTSFEQIFAIAISASAGVYVTGITNSTDFPGTATGGQTTIGGGFADTSAFISLLNAGLTALTRSSYFGADGQDTAFGVAVNSTTGDVYIAGGTASLSLPKTLGGAQRVRQGPTDNYVARFNGALTQLLGATYYGGTGGEGANDVDVDSATGDVFAAGTTFSTRMPGTTAGAQRIYADGGLDAFVVRFNDSLTAVRGATFLGGGPDAGQLNNSGYDEAVAVRYNAARDEVYVAGYTASSDFPKREGGAQATRGGAVNDAGVDGFLTRLTPDLNALFAPQELVVDPAPGAAADGNGVLEPGETAAVQPSWKNLTASTVSLSGAAAGFTGPPGATYTIPDTAASYGSVAAGAIGNCATVPNCFSLSVSAPATRPASHWDATFVETPSPQDAPMRWTLHVGDSFTDVPRSYPFYRKIETVLHNGVTVGCTATQYCLLDKVPRANMAIFIGRAIAGGAGFLPDRGVAGGAPYSCTVANGVSLFSDVAPTHIACPAIHYLVALNVATGCGVNLFCTAPNVNRGEMAIFMARGVVAPGGGAAVPSTYGPDPVTGRSYSCIAGSPNLHFTDVAATDLFCKHVHFLWARGIIDGCSATQYCPAADVTRDAMAKFLSNAFALPLYAP
jgi:hypothetical protein